MVKELSPWCGLCSCPSRCHPACRNRPPLWSSVTPACFARRCLAFALTRQDRGGQWATDEDEEQNMHKPAAGRKTHRLHAPLQINHSAKSKIPHNFPQISTAVIRFILIFDFDLWFEKILMLSDENRMQFAVFIRRNSGCWSGLVQISRGDWANWAAACHRRAAGRWRWTCLKNGRRLKGSCPGEQRHTHRKMRRRRRRRPELLACRRQRG